MDGDSDSVGCIAGAVSGAYNGDDAIPVGWRTTVEQADLRVETAAALLAFASSSA